MTVQDFLPLRDYKSTVERKEKPKPKIEELTKVESPGRPVPATSLLRKKSDLKETRKTKIRKTAKTDPSSIEKQKQEYTLIITEKPQAAQKIALALGNARKYTEGGVSYFELTHNDEKIIVASAVGHLFNLEYKKGQKGYPIFEIEWRPSFEKKNSAFTKRYFDLIKKLSKKSKEFIIATDYDIEGEVIGWNVLRFICNRNNAKRMKFSTLTKNELVKSYENPLEELDWGHAYAGEARHILDWLYGINLSRALMAAIKKTGSFKILSIGRVQGPSLKIIVEREREIANFKSVPYWQVFATVNGFDFKHPQDIFDKEQLKKFENLKSGIAETVEKEEKILPPPPFDLTTLQREAYGLHKISPSQTLATAQKLYLDGLISYPRTSSQKIPESIQFGNILKELQKHFPEVKEAVRAKPIEGKKDDPAHPSIFPTGEFRDLEGDDKKLYDLIVKRFISVFCSDAVTQNKRVSIKADEDTKISFTASGLKIKEKGWTKVYPSNIEEKQVPTLNGKVNFDEIRNVEKETQPPKRFTPASLISLLEKKNLGTKATRTMIVDTLFERGYLDGKSIKATPLGMKLIEALEKNSPIIIDENLTIQLEKEMEEIQERRKDEKSSLRETLENMKKEIVKKAEKIILDITKEFKIKEKEIGTEILQGIEGLREEQAENNTLITCPKCNKGKLRILYSRKTSKYFVACNEYPNCTQTYSLPPNALIKKSEKNCESCSFPKLLSIKKGKRPWEFCFNPECDVNKERLREYREKKLLENKK